MLISSFDLKTTFFNLILQGETLKSPQLGELNFYFRPEYKILRTGDTELLGVC